MTPGPEAGEVSIGQGQAGYALLDEDIHRAPTPCSLGCAERQEEVDVWRVPGGERTMGMGSWCVWTSDTDATAQLRLALSLPAS